MITITIPAAAPRTLWAKREHTRASLGDQQLLFSPGEEGNYDDDGDDGGDDGGDDVGEDNHYHHINIIHQSIQASLETQQLRNLDNPQPKSEP